MDNPKTASAVPDCDRILFVHRAIQPGENMSSFMAVLLIAISQAEVKTSEPVQYLQRLRHEDGGYGASASTKESTLSACSAALRALKLWNGTPQQLNLTRRFVWSCFQADKGQFADTPHGTVTYRSTAVGVMAVVAMGERFTPADLSRIQVSLLKSNDPEEIRLGAAAIETLVLDGQLQKVPGEWQSLLHRVFKSALQPDGSFGSGMGQARTTAGYAAAFLRLGYPITGKERILEIIRQQQHARGGWTDSKGQPDLEATYRVMRCLFLLRQTDAVMLENCEKFIAGCRQTDGGYAQPGSGSSVSATYFAGSVKRWISELKSGK